MALTAITDSAPSIGVKGSKQFQGLFSVIPFKITLTDASVAASETSQADFACAGAELGDIVMIAAPVDLDAGVLTAAVLSAGNITVTFANHNTGAANTSLSTGPVCKGVVLKPSENVFAQL